MFVYQYANSFILNILISLYFKNYKQYHKPKEEDFQTLSYKTLYNVPFS